MKPPVLDVFADVPDHMVPKAAWALQTMLAPLGARARLVRERPAAPGCVLAYAPAPVPGVPTIPASGAAHDLIAGRQAAAGGVVRAARGARRDARGGVPRHWRRWWLAAARWRPEAAW